MTVAAVLRTGELWVLRVFDRPLRLISGGQGGDLDQVVGEDPLSGPGLAPSRLSRRPRSQPYPRLRVLIRPSQPVRYLTVRRNARRCSTCCRFAPGLPLRGITTFRTPRSTRAWSTAASPYPRSAVTVRGARPVRAFTRSIAGAN